MPLLGDGSAELTQMDPGASGWLAQANANFLQINNRQPWASVVTPGEDIEAGRWVFMHTDGKVYKANWNVGTEYLVVGVALSAMTTDVPGLIHQAGKVALTPGVGIGGRMYLTTDGQISSTPADASDLAKKLVVGLQWSATEVMVTCMGTLTAF